jgi:hypothetical protein
MGNMIKSALHKGTLLTALFHLIGWSGFLAVAVLPASAQFKAWVMAKLPDVPRGLGTDSKGNIYASLLNKGEVVMQGIAARIADHNVRQLRLQQ